MPKVRPPYVAGAFYAGSPELLREQLEWCFTDRLGPGSLPKVREEPLEDPVGLVSPHAGYQYSGPVAAWAFHLLAELGRPETAVIVGTNHTGLGPPISIWIEGRWETPLGQMEIDTELARAIMEAEAKEGEGRGLIGESEAAFLREHSVEVQLPFLQFLFGGTELEPEARAKTDVRFVPLVCLDQRAEAASALGRALAGALQQIERSVVLIASSDFTHYEPHEVACRKDREAIERILELDLPGFYEVIRRSRVTICGYGAIAAVMEAARLLELKETKLLRYATSGEVTGDLSGVVGYASIALQRVR